MKKIIVRTFSMFLAIILVLGIFPLTSLAASVTYYQTNKADVPIWSQASKSSTKIRTISTKGTVLRVTSSTKNSSGNLWYKLSDGYWVYSGNVSKHSHSYTGGICTGRSCGYEWPYSVTSFSATVVVTNSSGAKIWSRPYSNKSTHVRTASVNTVLSIVAKTTNQEGNLWLKTSDGYWVYSDNVTRRYTVSYNANGGNGAPSAQTYLSGRSLTISSKKPTRTGYIFQGWATSSGSSSVSYKSGSTYSMSGNKTLYAVWKTCSHPAYTGGYCESCNYQYPYSVSSYYGTFVVTNSNGAKIWSRPYSNKSTHVRTAAVNTVLSVVAKTVNAEGNLWYKLSDGYWVYWENVKQRYTVSYNANGGSGAPYSHTYLAGKSVKISSTKPTRTGYIFQGWATSSGSSSVSYKSGSTYSMSGDKTLYAVWKTCSHPAYTGGYCESCNYQYPYSVSSYYGTFVVTNSNGAKIWSRPYSNKSTHVRTASVNTVLSIVAKTTNQEGNLWYKLSDGYWVYSKNIGQKFTVSYNANGGSGAPSAQEYVAGKKVTISTKKPTRTGYVFQGWSTSSGSSSVSYKSGSTYSMSGSKTLYAVWKACKHPTFSGGYCKTCGYEYQLKITAASGTFVVTNDAGAKVWSRPYSKNSKNVRTASYNEVLTVKAKTENQAGNVWYQLSDNNWIYCEHVTQRFTVSYDANGGSKAPSRKTFLSGKTIKISKSEPVRANYIFQGWSTSKDSSWVSYKPGESYSKKQDLKLYAVWKECSHKKYVGGYCSDCNYEYPISVSKINYTAVVTNRDGASIWSRPYSDNSKKLSTKKYNSVFKVTGKTTNEAGNVWYQLADGSWVYSKNVKFQFTVTFVSDGGTNIPSAQKFLSGETLKISDKKPVKSGYVFQGWSTSAEAKKVNYNPGASYSKKADLKLYAVWVKCSSHKYNGYGMCKNCGNEFRYTEDNKGVNKVVHTVNSSEGAAMYKRPYQNHKEKVKDLKKGTLVLVVAKTKNANEQTWYKLNNGYWVKEDYLKKKTTYNSMNSIEVESYDILAKGSISAKKITGAWYYVFTRDGKSVYLNVKAFSGESSNTKLDKVNANLTKAFNKYEQTGQSFVYNIKHIGSEKFIDKQSSAYGTSFDVYEWELNNLVVKGGIKTSEICYVNCKTKGTLHLSYDTYVNEPFSNGTITNKTNPRKPSTASEYVYCLQRSVVESNLRPHFDVSVTQSPGKYDPKTGEYYFSGYFTSYELKGHGFAKKSLKLADYIDLFTSAEAVVSGAIALVQPHVAIAKTAYDLIIGTYEFSTKVQNANASSAYSTDGTNPLTYGEGDNPAVKVYRFKLKSPIKLKEVNDYIQSDLYMYNTERNQKFDVKITFK